MKYDKLIKLKFVKQTFQHGITQTSTLVNVTDFYQAHILPDIQNPDGKFYWEQAFNAFTSI